MLSPQPLNCEFHVSECTVSILFVSVDVFGLGQDWTQPPWRSSLHVPLSQDVPSRGYNFLQLALDFLSRACEFSPVCVCHVVVFPTHSSFSRDWVLSAVWLLCGQELQPHWIVQVSCPLNIKLKCWPCHSLENKLPLQPSPVLAWVSRNPKPCFSHPPFPASLGVSCLII